MLNRGYALISRHKTGRECRVANVFSPGWNFHHRIEVHSTKNNARVNRGRIEGQVDLLSSVKANTCGLDRIS